MIKELKKMLIMVEKPEPLQGHLFYSGFFLSRIQNQANPGNSQLTPLANCQCASRTRCGRMSAKTKQKTISEFVYKLIYWLQFSEFKRINL